MTMQQAVPFSVNEISFEDLRSEIAERNAISFLGFSEIGYAEPSLFEAKVRERLRSAIDELASPLVLVSGRADFVSLVVGDACEDMGIEAVGVFAPMRRLDLPVPGVRRAVFAKNDTFDFFPRTQDGQPFLPHVLRMAKSALLCAYGGGPLVVDVLIEAQTLDLDFEIDTSFKANPMAVARRAVPDAISRALELWLSRAEAS